MIQGEEISDGVLILQRVEHANLSGMFFFGAYWVRVASGCIVDGNLDPMESVSLLLFGFKKLSWKWIRTENRSEGKYFYPMSLVTMGKLQSLYKAKSERL